MAKSTKPMTKTELLGKIAEDTGLSKKEVGAVIDSLSGCIAAGVGKRGCGKFILPGLLKVEKRIVPARKAKKGVPNPFKPGELMDVKARPASAKVVVRPLKNLKDMV